MRVTALNTYRHIVSSLQSLNETAARINQQLSSGKKLVSLKDNPSGSAELVQLQSKLAELDQYKSNAGQGTLYLQVADSGLNDVQNLITSIYTLASQAASETNSNDNCATITREIREMRDQILSIANSTARGRYIFAGSAVLSAPFTISNDTVTYQGDSEVNTISVDDGFTVQLNVPGDEIFTPIFDYVSSMLTSLDAGDIENLKTTLTQFSSIQSGLSLARGQVGLSLGRIENAAAALDTEKTNVKSEASRVGDVDVAEATTQLSQTQTALQATLATAQSALAQKNLFDFLV